MIQKSAQKEVLKKAGFKDPIGGTADVIERRDLMPTSQAATAVNGDADEVPVHGVFCRRGFM
jgi:hypothetical protein